MRVLGPEDLPPRGLFPPQMPRYPNLWFLVHRGVLARAEYPLSVRWLVGLLEDRLGLRDTFVRDVENPNPRCLLDRPGEGSVIQARIGPLQPFTDPEGRSHRHQVHARFYVTPLMAAGRTELDGRFVVPAGVHYEVATEDPLHPYADSCPLCGITGDYDLPIDRGSQDYCLKIHDPLGLEFLLHGTVRGVRVRDDAGAPVACLGDLSCRIRELGPEVPPAHDEPLRLALVSFDPD